MAGALDGYRILVPESRDLDLFAGMLAAQGATTLRCPMVAILDPLDPAPVEAWIGRLAEGRFDDLVLLTGEGLRRLLGIAERAEMKDQAVPALGRIRTIIRGPKPARALREIGLTATISAPAPTTDGVIDALQPLDLGGRTVGVQLYPGNPNDKLLQAVRDKGGSPDPVLPYRYASDAEAEDVARAIRAMAEGSVDVIAFTSTPQLVRLQDVAAERGLEAELSAGLARTRLAAVGPVVADALTERGLSVWAQPEKNFHLKPLVSAIVDAAGRG